MAEVTLNNIITEVEITKAELLNLLVDKATQVGIIDFVPTKVEVKKIQLATDPGPQQVREEGWRITFTGDRQ